MDDAFIMRPASPSARRRWASLAIVLFGQFAVSIDLTVLNVALPEIAAEIQPTSDEQLWIVDVYSLVLAGLLVSASSLSDRIGRKRMILAGFALFGIASTFALVATSALAVIALRAALGVAGAMIMPSTISIIRSIFPDARERAFALAGWSVIGGIGMATGPIIGGLLLECFSWHAAFLVNVPIMSIAFIAGAAVLPEIRVEHPGTWDAVAAVLSLGGIALFLWGMKRLVAAMVLDGAALVALAVGAVLVAAFVLRSLSSKTPLVDVSLFRSKPFTAGVVAALGSVFAMEALLYLVTQWNQLVDACTPLESGVRMLPMALACVIIGFAAPALAEKLGARTTVAGGLALSGAAMIALLAFWGNLDSGPVIVASCLAGVGGGSLTIASAMISYETPIEKASSAASLEEISYDLGAALGVAVLGSLASMIYRAGLDPAALAATGVGSDAFDKASQSLSAAVEIATATGSFELLAEAQSAFSSSIVVTSAAGGAVMVAIALVVWRLVPKSLNVVENRQNQASSPTASERI